MLAVDDDLALVHLVLSAARRPHGMGCLAAQWSDDRSTLVIVVTAWPATPDKIAGRSVSATDPITKRSPFDEILALIRVVLRDRRLEVLTELQGDALCFALLFKRGHPGGHPRRALTAECAAEDVLVGPDAHPLSRPHPQPGLRLH